MRYQRQSKRTREEACYICNHYHDYHGGEPCSVCGHVKASLPGEGGLFVAPTAPAPQPVQDPTLILNDFLYLGGYDAASRRELLRTLGVSHVLNCVPTLEVLYRTSFTYHTASASPPPLEECFRFLDACYERKQRVLVYCMRGRSQAPMLVVAYLMKLKGWRLAESYRWVRDRRPMVELEQEDFERLVEAERGLFGSASVQSLRELEGGGQGGGAVDMGGAGGSGGGGGSNNLFFHLGGEDRGGFQFGEVMPTPGGFVFGGRQE